jgi:hypothetical protein
MKIFVLKLLVFLLPVVLVAMIFEYGLSKVQNSYNIKRANLEKQLNTTEVLLIGNSRTLYGINPSYFSHQGYNLSNVSQTLFYIKELGVQYVPQMPELKCVIIDVSPTGFGSDLIDGKEHWRDYYYSQYWNIDFPENNWYDIKRYSKFFLYQPIQSCYYASRCFRVNLAPDLSPNGWLLVQPPKTKNFLTDSVAAIRASLINENSIQSRFAQNAANLENLVSIVTKQNVACVIITSPVYKTFSKYVDKSKFARGVATIKDICERYHCEYINYFDDDRFTIEDFADNDHFNYIGAIKYSKIINHEIVEKYCKNKMIKPFFK